jgi:hypothetical protein
VIRNVVLVKLKAGAAEVAQIQDGFLELPAG